MKTILSSVRNHWKLILFFITMVLFYYFVDNYFENELAKLDNIVYSWIIYFKNNVVTWIMKFITMFCSTLVLFLISFSILIFVKNKKYAIYIGLNLIIVFFINTVVKLIVARPRPTGINLIDESGFSFPSGHAMVSVAFYGFLVYIIAHLKIKKSFRIAICSTLMILTGLIGISRIYLGVHYASDVFAGFSLGLAYLMIFISCCYDNIKYRKEQ